MASQTINQVGKNSPHSKKEQQLLKQLSQLDLKLKNKVLARQICNSQNLWDYTENKIEKQGKNLNKDTSKIFVTAYNPHMQYFSQIGNQDVDQDSLFDTNSNFLQQQGLLERNLANYSKSNANLFYKKSYETDQNEFLVDGKQSQKGYDYQPNSFQISNKSHYSFKKQCGKPSAINKQSAIQKNNRINHQKKLLITEKSIGTLKDSLKSRQSNEKNKKKSKQRQKNNLKTNAIKQEIIIHQQEINRFESALAKALQFNPPEKSAKNIKCLKEDPNQHSLECTFKPTILKKSSQMAKSTVNVVERLSNINQSKQKKPYMPQVPKPLLNKQRIEELSQPRKLKTLGPQLVEETPSFRPSLSKKSLEQMSNCTYDVATRNQLWLEQKNEKLQRLKQEQQLQRSKREFCTYSPALCQYKRQNDVNFSKFGKQGIVNYFERLYGANNRMTKPKAEESFVNKQNKFLMINQSKGSYVSKGGKKQNYEEAVKQLHTRIMKLKI